MEQTPIETNREVSEQKTPHFKMPGSLFCISKPYTIATTKGLLTVLVGMSSVTAILRKEAAMLNIMMTIVMFAFLAQTFWSIARKHDLALVHRPTVHKSDGTIASHDPISVFEYDKRVGIHIALEFSAFTVATVWFYQWTQNRFIVLVYTGSMAFKILTHPLFRIHIWQESHSNELDRPFGSTALFKKDESAVKMIHGLQAFKSALRNASSGALVIVDVSATWCGPCRTMAPIFEALASEYQSCTFLSVDVDISQDVAKMLNISSIPTFLIYKDSKQLEVLRGASPVALRAAIQNNL